MYEDDKYGLPTNYNSQLIQEYLGFANQAVRQQRGAALGQVAANQSILYEALGRQQLQSERDIAQRRIQAQRSGMTSAQLAAFEMQNIMAGQLGSQQVAQQALLETAALETQYAGLEAQNQARAFEIMNSNRANVAAIDAQRYAASAITQIKELFPNATPEQLQILARQYLGFDLTADDKKVIKSLIAPDTGGTYRGTGGVTFGYSDVPAGTYIPPVKL